MRKQAKSTLFFISFCVLILFISGCTTPNRISSDQTKEFREEIQKEYPVIESVSLEFVPTTINMLYTLKKPVSEEEKKNIFEQSQELLMSETFDQEIIQGKFSKKYSESGHPDFMILLKVEDPPSTSRFEIHADDSESADSVYTQWYYSKNGDTNSEPFFQEGE